MAIEIRSGSVARLGDYARIPIAFEVNQLLDVAGDAVTGLTLIPRPLTPSYVKDYDATVGEHPVNWPNRFDVSRWGVLAAFDHGDRVGGAVIAYDTPALDMLDGRTDLAVLWDIRVAHQYRRRGVGSALFTAAEAWARARGCRELKIETQNVNVAACSFYARQGCLLKAARHGAYGQHSDEIQLLWYKIIEV